MKIDEAKEEFDFFNEGDYITRGMSIAKDVVLQELENTRADLYEANNRIADLLDVAKERDRIIDWLVEEIHSIINLGEFIDNNINKLDTKEQIKKYFEERCKDAND